MPIAEAKAPPPKRSPGRPSGQSSSSPNMSKVAGYQAALQMLAGTGVMLTSFAKQPADSMAIANYAGDERTIRKLAENATRNVYFGKLLDLFEGTGGPIVETIILVMPLAMQVLCNHGMIPPNPAMGVLPKEVLEMQARQAAIAAQQEAEKLAEEAMALAEGAPAANGFRPQFTGA